MLRLISRIALVAGLAMVSATSWAVFTGEPDHLLTADEAKRLPEPAREHYRDAERAFDHIDRDSGIQHLDLAAQAAPDYVPIQFALAARARDRGKFHHGGTAMDYYDLAESAIQRILRQPFLPLEDKQRAERLLRDVQTERETLPAKDKKMAEVGFRAIVLPKAIQRAMAKGDEVTPDMVTQALGEQAAPEQPPGALVPGVATGQLPMPGAGTVPLASYGVPTEKPPEPQPGTPGYRGAHQPGMDPMMMMYGPEFR